MIEGWWKLFPIDYVGIGDIIMVCCTLHYFFGFIFLILISEFFKEKNFLNFKLRVDKFVYGSKLSFGWIFLIKIDYYEKFKIQFSNIIFILSLTFKIYFRHLDQIISYPATIFCLYILFLWSVFLIVINGVDDISILDRIFNHFNKYFFWLLILVSKIMVYHSY